MRRLVARVGYAGGLIPVRPKGAIILAYHGVAEKVHDRWMERGVISLTAFQDHLRFLERRRAVVALNEVLAEMSAGKSPDPAWTVLCFDDGLASVHQYVLPELAARKWPFTIGLPSGLPGSGRSLWEYEIAFLVYLLNARGALGELAEMMRANDITGEQSSRWRVGTQGGATREWTDPRVALASVKHELRVNVSSNERLKVIDRLIESLEPDLRELLERDGRFRMMTWTELAEALGAGGHIAAHGWLHQPHNERLTETCRLRELQGPLETIGKCTGQAVDTFIWPEGVVSSRSVKIGTALGYRYFLSSRPGFVTQATRSEDVPRVSAEWPLPQLLWNIIGLS